MKELQYLINTGNTWTSTGIVNKNTTKIHINYLSTQTPGTIGGSYISYIGAGDGYFRITYDTAWGKFYFNNCGKFEDTTIAALDGSLEMTQDEVYVNDILVANNKTHYSNTGKTIVFGADNIGGADCVRVNPVKYGEIIIYNGDDIEADFIPVIDDNNVVCWYNKTDSTYHYTISGTYEAGPVAHIFEANISKLSYDNVGGMDTFTVTAESNWTVDAPEWGTLSPLSGGEGVTDMSFTVGEYSGTERRRQNLHFEDVDGFSFELPVSQKAPRGAGWSNLFMGEENTTTLYIGTQEIMTLYMGEQEVYSSGPFAGLKLSTKTIKAVAGGGTYNLKIKSSEDWTLSMDSSIDWITLSQTAGTSGETIVEVTIDETEAERNAVISATTNSYSDFCSISQTVFVSDFMFNYNAKNYDAATKTLRKQSGQLFDEDLVLIKDAVVGDGYLEIDNNYVHINWSSENENPFNRDANNPEITIIYKARWDNSNTIIGNRGGHSDYNWMARRTMFHTAYSGFLEFEPSVNPSTVYLTVDNNGVAYRKCVETGQYAESGGTQYGTELSTGISFFADLPVGQEAFKGDFYWMFCALRKLTDEEIQNVINYNENL